MNRTTRTGLDGYVRRTTRNEPRGRRQAAREALRDELELLASEAMAEGTGRDEAERQAVETHRRSAPAAGTPWSWRAWWTAPWSPASWRGLAYLVALFPVGVASLVWAVGGGGLVLGLMPLFAGFLLAGPFLLSLPHLGRVHGVLATWATGQPMPMLHTTPRVEGRLLQRLGQRLRDRHILFSFLSCLTAYLWGTVGFGWVAGVGAVAAFLLLSPFVPGFPVMPGDGGLYPDWLLEREPVMVAAGLATVWLLAWGSQALAWLAARTTRGVLTQT